MDFLNEDLTAVVTSVVPFLKQCIGKGKEIPPGSILQVQQIINLSFPTYDKPHYDADKHTLKITVTDGQTQGNALLPDSCPGISLNTAPGTKIKTTQTIPLQGNLFVLTRNNCEVLGGRVPKLYEKWEIQKKMAFKHEWGYTGSSVEGEGPPTWKPFGYKPSIDVAALRKMKTIDVVNDKKDAQPGGIKTQFDMQRDEAISELQATANKQKFQKPNKHLLDKDITDIMDEGFPQGEAEYAMSRFKNVQKAIKFLKESKKWLEGPPPPKEPKPMVERKDRRKKGKDKDDDEEQEVPAEYQRPTKSISLFGFIEGQIKIGEGDKPVQSNGPSSLNYGRSRDLEDSMGRMNIRDSYSYNSSRNDRGHRGYDRGRGRGYRGRGGGDGGRGGGDGDGGRGAGDGDSGRGGRGGNREPFQSQTRYESKGLKTEPTEKPPRFQNRGGPDNRTEYHFTPPARNIPNTASGALDKYDIYPRCPKEYDYDSRTYPDTHFKRHEYSGNYQQRPATVKDRSPYGSEYQHQQHYSKSNDYPPVPSNTQSYQQHSYQQQQANLRQMVSNSIQNHERHRGGNNGQQRPSTAHFANHSSGNHPNPPPHSEFTHYQYGYEGWNPAQSLVFTRSKPGEPRGGGRGGGGGGGGAGYQGNGRGNPGQNNTYGRNHNRY